jgi:hypothetical protein
MNQFSVRRSTVILAGFAGLSLAAGCQDKRVKELDTGITRDSALSVISQDVKGTGPDSLPNVYVTERYLIGGKNYEVMFFTPNNEKIAKDTVPYKKLTPIVFVEHKLVGRGWGYWDSVSTANHIPLKKRD